MKTRARYRMTPWPRAIWWHWWTPAWHAGRGPYIPIGLWVVALYRGY